jgi:hypothetical protein
MRARKCFPIFTIAAVLSVTPWASPQVQCPCLKPGEAYRVDGAVIFATAGLAVDADGAPNSYLADGLGLSETCVGVVAVVNGRRVNKKSDPAHWYAICQKAWSDAQTTGDYSHVSMFGFLSDKSGPMLQKEGDPLPGKAYITTTTLTVPGTLDKTQRHWVDATKVPYIVLSPAFQHDYHVKPGDLAVVYRPKTGTIAFAVFADSGDLGEASVKLHQDLGNDPITTSTRVARANRSIADRVVTLVFPGVNIVRSSNLSTWYSSIQISGKAALETWGGSTRLRSCSSSSK